tara:strand:+ start:824 stop:991 length:168 start_codon:yes stop_codon:yes gene_type:complete
MINYYVHYSMGTDKGLMHMIAPVKARTELDAIAKIKATHAGSFGHWVNRLANEAL